MPILTVSKTINGERYEITQLPAIRALHLQADLMRIFAPAMAYFVFSQNSLASLSSFNGDSAAKAVQNITSMLPAEEYENLVIKMLQGVRKGGLELTRDTINMEFAGDIGSLWSVLWAVLEVNFGDFFAKSGIGELFKSKTQ